jgi:Fe-S-cluster-containing dehydrogenase component
MVGSAGTILRYVAAGTTGVNELHAARASEVILLQNTPNPFALKTEVGFRVSAKGHVTLKVCGVMEKCTYCVQRINAARIEAEKQSRPIRDGEVVTACQQACPTQAIVFGDINDPKSLVHEMKYKQPFVNHDYGLLNEELGTRPRTTYLPRIVLTPSPTPPGKGVTNHG